MTGYLLAATLWALGIVLALALDGRPPRDIWLGVAVWPLTMAAVIAWHLLDIALGRET